MKPNAKNHDPCPIYIRELIQRTGMIGEDVAARIGISVRMLRYYTAPVGGDWRPAPYLVQYALEQLARKT